jgi:hypothetical protein
VRDWADYVLANERSLRDYDVRMNWGSDGLERSDYVKARRRQRDRLRIRTGDARPRIQMAEGCIGVDVARTTRARGCRCEHCSGPRGPYSMPEVDQVKVDRVLTGGAASLNRAEIREVVLACVQRGEDVEMIADRLRQTQRNVERIKSKLRKEARL